MYKVIDTKRLWQIEVHQIFHYKRANNYYADFIPIPSICGT